MNIIFSFANAEAVPLNADPVPLKVEKNFPENLQRFGEQPDLQGGVYMVTLNYTIQTFKIHLTIILSAGWAFFGYCIINVQHPQV